jgi:DNA-binding beta-propeller fold protein YncE
LEWAVLTAALVVAPAAHATTAFVTSNSVKIVDGAAGSVVGSIDLGKSFVRDIAVTSNGQTAFFAHTRGIAVVDVATSQITGTWSDRTVNDLVLREDEGLLYTLQHRAGEPYEVVVYTLSTGSEARRFEVDPKTFEISVAGSGRLFATNVTRGTITSYDRLSGAVRQEVPVVNPTGATDAETYVSRTITSPDGRFVYVLLNGERAGVLVVDALTADTVSDIRLGHPAYVRDGVLSPDGGRLFLSALDHLSVVDLATKQEIAWVNLGISHQGISISADGAELFLVSPVLDTAGAVSVVDARTFTLTRRIDVPEMSPFRVAVIP